MITIGRTVRLAPGVTARVTNVARHGDRLTFSATTPAGGLLVRTVPATRTYPEV